jgi:hypothetical protein
LLSKNRPHDDNGALSSDLTGGALRVMLVEDPRAVGAQRDALGPFLFNRASSNVMVISLRTLCE